MYGSGAEVVIVTVSGSTTATAVTLSIRKDDPCPIPSIRSMLTLTAFASNALPS
jgi:hypothetical protein